MATQPLPRRKITLPLPPWADIIRNSLGAHLSIEFGLDAVINRWETDQ